MTGLTRVGRVGAVAGLVILLAAAWWIVQLSPLNVPAVVRDRPALPSCGQEARTQTDGLNQEARRCFWDAYLANRPAEFISTRPTVEGDPITSIYRILAAGSIEVFVDQRQDRYSKGGWYRLACPGLRLIEGWREDFVPGLRDGDCTVTTLR
jgi:hypothetical protein